MYRCPACQLSYRVKNADPAKNYSCQKCKAVLVPVIATGETQAMVQGIPDLSAAAAHPTVVEAAASVPAVIDELALSPAAGATTPDLKDLLPQSFDGYNVIKSIARGGMGAVLLAEQVQLRRNVALKVMLPWAQAVDPEAQRRFTREARAMAKLRHPHIIEVYDVGEVNGMTYLAMEFIEGRTLSDVIADNALSLEKLCGTIAKVARALAYAHVRGVIHRDIKPANIMLRPTGEPVVMDFGLAKDFESNSLKLSVTGNIMGTPSYMSPEQAQGMRCDERSDLYSLGAVLYEGLTREPPFDGVTTIATIYDVVHKEPRPASELRPDIPEALSRICSKALEKEPRDRYQTMDEFAGDLDRFSAGMVIGAQGKSILRRGAEWSKKNRGLSGAILAAALMLLLTAGAISIGVLRLGKNKAAELRAALTSGSAETRLLHVKALTADLREKRIAAASPEEEDALAALRLAAADKDASGEVAAAALLALGELKDKKSADTVCAQLDSARPLNVRHAAIEAIAKIQPQGQTSFLSSVMQKDPSAQLRVAAIEALPGVVPPDLMVLLIELSVNGEPPVVATAAGMKLAQLRPSQSILSFYGGGGNSVRAAQEAGRIAAMTRDYNRELEEAMGELSPQASKNPPKAQPYEQASRKLLSSARAERLQAAYDLGVLGERRAQPALLRALEDSDNDVALAAAEALGRFSTIDAPQTVVPLLKSPSPATRRAAARACGLLRVRDSEKPLAAALLAEKLPPVQGEIATALGRMKAQAGVLPLLSLLKDGNAEAARKAARALGQIGEKNAASALVDALSRAGADAELRAEIAGALSAITGHAIGPDEAKWREMIGK
ncbi:MAG TPA: protein kinase [Planctomycetota bacterium]|nr:protein kinase [Planctomycetota bacterium]